MKEKDKFYGTLAWKKKREHILKRDGYKDQLELRAGRTVPAETVHHILPKDRYPQYALCDWNLISVSRETHEKGLHTIYGNLTEAGERLARETAINNGIKLWTITLVVGLSGAGKTTAVKQWIKKDALVYDLDYIAAAFRLAEPKKDDNRAARKMANAMVKSFAANVGKYASRAYIIRTAPTIEETEALNPDKIIYIAGQHVRGTLKQEVIDGMKERIAELKEWAILNCVEWVEA